MGMSRINYGATAMQSNATRAEKSGNPMDFEYNNGKWSKLPNLIAITWNFGT